jgi:hypothetical protein
MRQRCAFQRLFEIPDSGGGFNDAWSDYLTDVPCRTWWVSGTEVAVGSRIEYASSQILLVPLDTNVTTADRVARITRRDGTLLVDGPLNIESIGRRPDHLHLVLTSRLPDSPT